MERIDRAIIIHCNCNGWHEQYGVGSNGIIQTIYVQYDGSILAYNVEAQERQEHGFGAECVYRCQMFSMVNAILHTYLERRERQTHSSGFSSSSSTQPGAALQLLPCLNWQPHYQHH